MCCPHELHPATPCRRGHFRACGQPCPLGMTGRSNLVRPRRLSVRCASPTPTCPSPWPASRGGGTAAARIPWSHHLSPDGRRHGPDGPRRLIGADTIARPAPFRSLADRTRTPDRTASGVRRSAGSPGTVRRRPPAVDVTEARGAAAVAEPCERHEPGTAPDGRVRQRPTGPAMHTTLSGPPCAISHSFVHLARSAGERSRDGPLLAAVSALACEGTPWVERAPTPRSDDRASSYDAPGAPRRTRCCDLAAPAEGARSQEGMRGAPTPPARQDRMRLPQESSTAPTTSPEGPAPGTQNRHTHARPGRHHASDRKQSGNEKCPGLDSPGHIP